LFSVDGETKGSGLGLLAGAVSLNDSAMSRGLAFKHRLTSRRGNYRKRSRGSSWGRFSEGAKARTIKAEIILLVVIVATLALARMLEGVTL
jgi:hypothetical protein